MIEVDDLRPLPPIRPVRPERQRPKKRLPEAPIDKNKRAPTDDKDGDGKPHIDEYAHQEASWKI